MLKICAGSLLVIALMLAGLEAASRFQPRKPSGENAFFAAAKPPAEVRAILERSCFDCHSNGTKWPLYSHLPIIGDQMREHVANAKAQLNFSEWEALQSKGTEEVAGRIAGICETTLTHLMPLKSYLILHPRARLSEQETATLCDWSVKQQQKLLVPGS